MTIYSERAWERAFCGCSDIVGEIPSVFQEPCVGQSPFLLYGIRYRLSPAGWDGSLLLGDTLAINECAKVLCFSQIAIVFDEKLCISGKN